jgi:hypothetical protein
MREPPPQPLHLGIVPESALACMRKLLVILNAMLRDGTD